MRATTAGNIVAEETEETEGGPFPPSYATSLSLPEYELQTQKYFLRRVRLRKENTELHPFPNWEAWDNGFLHQPIRVGFVMRCGTPAFSVIEYYSYRDGLKSET